MSERNASDPSGSENVAFYQKVLDGFAQTIKETLRHISTNSQVFQGIPVHLKKETECPDLVVCPPGQVTDAECNGVPDWILEIVSPGAETKHVNLYVGAGVKEYWIVEPEAGQVITYCANQDHFHTHLYRFGDVIPTHAIPGVSVDTSRAAAACRARRVVPPSTDPADWIC